jgi:mRNA interferase HigB
MIVIGTEAVELVAAVQYRAGVLVIRFFGSHAEYDRIDAETV